MDYRSSRGLNNVGVTGSIVGDIWKVGYFDRDKWRYYHHC